jgi:hypothetical protein
MQIAQVTQGRKVDVDLYGTIRHYNEAGQLHRETGPACEYSDGTTYLVYKRSALLKPNSMLR